MARVGGVGLDLGAQATDVHIDQSAVTEIVVAPHFVEQCLSAEHLAGAFGQFAQQTELGLGEVDFVAVAQHLALVGDQFEVAEHQPLGARGSRANSTQQRTDAC